MINETYMLSYFFNFILLILLVIPTKVIALENSKNNTINTLNSLEIPFEYIEDEKIYKVRSALLNKEIGFDFKITFEEKNSNNTSRGNIKFYSIGTPSNRFLQQLGSEFGLTTANEKFLEEVSFPVKAILTNLSTRLIITSLVNDTYAYMIIDNRSKKLTIADSGINSIGAFILKLTKNNTKSKNTNANCIADTFNNRLICKEIKIN